jgi:hypothetical protein
MSREQQERDNVYLCPSCVHHIKETGGCRRAYQWLSGKTTICREYVNMKERAEPLKMARERDGE